MVTDEFRSRIVEMLSSPDNEMVELAIGMWVATTKEYNDYWYLKKEWDATYNSDCSLNSPAWCTRIMKTISTRSINRHYPLLLAAQIRKKAEGQTRKRQKEVVGKFKPGRIEVIQLTCQVKTKEEQKKKS